MKAKRVVWLLSYVYDSDGICGIDWTPLTVKSRNQERGE